MKNFKIALQKATMTRYSEFVFHSFCPSIISISTIIIIRYKSAVVPFSDYDTILY